jgi:hypothetical protein
MYRHNTEYLSQKDKQIFYLICHQYSHSCHIINGKIQVKFLEDNALREKIIIYLSELSSKPEEEINEMYSNVRRQQEIELKRQHEERERSKEANYFFNQSSSNATEDELEYWAKMPYWSPDEAVALAFGKSPEKISWDKIASYRDTASFPKKYMNTQKLLNRALLARELICEHDILRDTYRIKPCDFVSWAERKGIQISDGLKKRVLESGNNSINWQALYEEKCEEIQLLLKKGTDLKEECKKLKQDKAHIQRSLNTSDKLFTAVVQEKFPNNASIISNVQSCLQKQGVHADDKTIRDRYDRGLAIIKQKSD